MAHYEAPWNFSWVIPNLLAATSCPNTFSNLEYLKREGIKHLVTLSPDHLPPIENYEGLRWTYIPIVEFEAPTLNDIETFIQVCEGAQQNNEAVAVHCRAGRGRTGVMMACYFVRFLDMTPESAIHKIRSLRPWSVETYEQEIVVRNYRDYLRSI